MKHLRIFRELDNESLSELTRDYLLAFEGQSDFVDNDVPRDDVYTEEILAVTKAFHLVDDDGTSLAVFKDLLSAERAASGAKITVNVEVDIPEGEEVTA